VALIGRTLDSVGRTGTTGLTGFTDGCAGLRLILTAAGVTEPPILGRVGGDVAAPTPHSPGRADFPHPVLHERDSLAVA
jgi:hypothetical protein